MKNIIRIKHFLLIIIYLFNDKLLNAIYINSIYDFIVKNDITILIFH